MVEKQMSGDDPIHELIRLIEHPDSSLKAELSDLDLELFRLNERRLARQRDARRPDGKRYVARESRNALIREQAIIRETLPEAKRPAELWITYSPLREGALRLRALQQAGTLPAAISEVLDPDQLNGYVWFPKRDAPKIPVDTKELVKYIPVHGGVSYAAKDSSGVVFGFDTAHFNSEKFPRTDPDWIRYQCRVLYLGLEVAEQLWPEYRRAGEKRRTELAQKLFDLDEAASGGFADRIGFEALISLMCGKV